MGLVLDDGLVNDIRAAVVETIGIYFQLPVECGTPEFVQEPILPGEIGARIGIRQLHLEGWMILSFPQQTLHTTLTHIYGAEILMLKNAVHDGAAELANSVYGMFKTKAAERGFCYEMSLPQVFSSDEVSTVASASYQTVMLSFSTSAGQFWAAVTVEDNPPS